MIKFWNLGIKLKNMLIYEVMALLILIKFTFFYSAMGVQTNLFFTIFFSSVLTYLIFFSFKNKLIPSLIYLVLSLMMFADFTYFSFFNKYISLDIFNNATMLGAVSGSIKEIISWKNFVILADAIFIFIFLFFNSILQKTKSKTDCGKTNKIVGNGSKIKVLSKEIIKKASPIFALILIFSIAQFSASAKAVSNQEFYAFHVGDITRKALKIEEKQKLVPFEDYYMNEKQGEEFGIGKGKNLVLIQVESFQNFLIGFKYNAQEVTPFLNSLIKNDSAYFDNYFQQVGTGNTSDAEYATTNSFLGSFEPYTYKLYDKNYYRGLPKLLKEKGYFTAVMHAHENKNFWNRNSIYPQMGIDRFYVGLKGTEAGGDFKMTEWMGWGLTDTEFFEQSMDYIKDFKQPFYSMIITLSNHHPYEMLPKYSFLDLKEEDKHILAANYLNSAAYTDYALSELFDRFKEAGLYENTVFAIYGDHRGIEGTVTNKRFMKKALGHEYKWDDMMNIPLIIHVPRAAKSFTKTIHNVGGQTDFLPTIAYIMGFEKLDTLYLGHNLFNYKDEVVAQHAYMPRGSFFANGIAFEMSRDGIFENGEAWDMKTKKKVDNAKIKKYYLQSQKISDTSIFVQKNDILRKVYEEGMSLRQVMNQYENKSGKTN